jgi:hypothetical protein
MCVWEGATKTNEKYNASWFGMCMCKRESVCMHGKKKVREWEHESLCECEREQWQFIDDNFILFCMYQVLWFF